MRKLLMSLTLLGGVAGGGVVAQAAPHVVALAVHPGLPQVETVQYHPDYRYREWRRHQAYERWRRHEEWRRGHHYRGW